MICKTYVISPDDYKTLGKPLRHGLMWMVEKLQLYAGLLSPIKTDGLWDR
jgi:hypothetical protein